MTTYYCHTLEEALKRAKIAGKRPGYWYGGITLKSGKKGVAISKEGKVIEQYSVIGRIGKVAGCDYLCLVCDGLWIVPNRDSNISKQYVEKITTQTFFIGNELTMAFN